MSPGGSSGSLMNKKRIDLIFCSVNKHKVNMTFDVFLQALIKIAEFKYNERSSEALQELITDFMVPLHSKIHSKT
jgi:hypothetical protein